VRYIKRRCRTYGIPDGVMADRERGIAWTIRYHGALLLW
jgi:hypothetical protein